MNKLALFFSLFLFPFLCGSPCLEKAIAPVQKRQNFEALPFKRLQAAPSNTKSSSLWPSPWQTQLVELLCPSTKKWSPGPYAYKYASSDVQTAWWPQKLFWQTNCKSSIFLGRRVLKLPPKICLNMIVKNESGVIRRCLDSVKHLIDYWIIVDTGSMDGTQEIIKDHMKDIPGELYERRWRNFGDNRMEALELAKGKGEYLLFMDADDMLEFEKDFTLPILNQDLYKMWRETNSSSFSYHTTQLVKADLPWKWVGVVHEYLSCPVPFTSKILQKVRYVSGEGGASSYDPKKMVKYVQLLEEGLNKEPNNCRYVFYLAECYRFMGEKGKALEWYQKRVLMRDWDEEIFWSKLQISHLMKEMGLPLNVVAEAYLDAHHFRPHRAEPIYYLSALYNQQGNYSKAYEYLKKEISKPAEKDWLFNEDWIEEYGFLLQLSICSYYLGHYQESVDACDQLLVIKELPEGWREQAKINRTFPIARLKEQSSE